MLCSYPWGDQPLAPQPSTGMNYLSTHQQGFFSSSQLLFSTKPVGTVEFQFGLEKSASTASCCGTSWTHRHTKNRIPYGQAGLIFPVFLLNILLVFHCRFPFSSIILYSSCCWQEEFERADKESREWQINPRRLLIHTCLSSCFMSLRKMGICFSSN